MVELKGTSGLLDQFGKPITRAQHANLQHTIGAEIEAPTIINEYGVASLGSSGIPAREDHRHGGNTLYFSTTAAMNAVTDAPTGTIANAGISAGTVGGGNAPRTYLWDGSAWVFIDWWGAGGRPGVELTRSGQSIANSTNTDITSYTETQDEDGWYPASGTTVTVPTGWAGQWLISAAGAWAAGAGTVSGLSIVVDGNNFSGAATNPQNSVGSALTRTLAVGATVRVAVFQNSGAAVSINVRLAVRWIGP